MAEASATEISKSRNPKGYRQSAMNTVLVMGGLQILRV